MRTKEQAKDFVSANSRKIRAALYRRISRRKNLSVRQMLQLQVRFGQHQEWLKHLGKLL